jgi:hypothetical protein
MISPFTILDFDAAEDPAVVYLESQTSARYREKVDELAEYRRIFNSLEKQSVPIEEYSRGSPGMEKVKQVRSQRR